MPILLGICTGMGLLLVILVVIYLPKKPKYSPTTLISVIKIKNKELNPHLLNEDTVEETVDDTLPTLKASH